MSQMNLPQARSGASVNDRPIGGLSDKEIALRFESLGGTGHGCEFGLYQRSRGAEPLGLLRWADLLDDLLMEALESRFAGVGLPDNTVVFNPDHSDEWWTRDTRFWMAMRTFIKVADINLEDMIERACRRLQFLKSKLIVDLQAGEKIFVFRNMVNDLSEPNLLRLYAAVRAYGPSTLLYIQYATPLHPNGTVEVRAPGLLVGFIDHFAYSPQETYIGPVNDHLQKICKRALELCPQALSADSHTPAEPGPTNEVLTDSTKAVLVGQESAHYRTYRVSMLLDAGQSAEAEVELRIAVDAEPLNVHLRVLLCRLLHRVGNVDEAYELIQKGVEASPDSPELYDNLAPLFEARGDNRQRRSGGHPGDEVGC